MAYKTVNLPALVTPTTSSTFAGPVGLLDDASCLTIYLMSTATALSSGSALQVSQFDPASTGPENLVVQSTLWFNYAFLSSVMGVPIVSSSGVAITINNISFRGIRISLLGSANVANEKVAYITKQITV